MYVWIVRIPFQRARGKLFSLKKHGFLGFIPVYSETTAYHATNWNRNGSPLSFQVLTAPAKEFKTVNNSISRVMIRVLIDKPEDSV